MPTETYIVCRYDDGETRQFPVYESGSFDTSKLFRADAYVIAMHVLQVSPERRETTNTMRIERHDIRDAWIDVDLEAYEREWGKRGNLMTISYVPQRNIDQHNKFLEWMYGTEQEPRHFYFKEGPHGN